MIFQRGIHVGLFALACACTNACGDDGAGDDEATGTGAPATSEGGDEDSTGAVVPTSGGEAETGGAETTGGGEEAGESTGDETTGGEPLPEGPGLHCWTPGAPIVELGPEGPLLVTTFALGGEGQVGELDAQVHISGVKWTSYLRLRLIHAGAEATLLEDTCENNKDIDVTFDDEAAPAACCPDIFCTGDPLTGVIAPIQPLAPFAGTPLAGEWTLEIVSPTWTMSQPNQGVLEKFCLDLK